MANQTATPTDRARLVRKANETAVKLKGALNYSQSSNQNDRLIGVTQLRALADACQQAEAVIEIEALLDYQRGRGVSGSKGWASKVGDQDAATIVQAAMQQIAPHDSAMTEEDRLATLARFFGYLYRAAIANRPAGVGGQRS